MKRRASSRARGWGRDASLHTISFTWHVLAGQRCRLFFFPENHDNGKINQDSSLGSKENHLLQIDLMYMNKSEGVPKTTSAILSYIELYLQSRFQLIPSWLWTRGEYPLRLCNFERIFSEQC